MLIRKDRAKLYNSYWRESIVRRILPGANNSRMLACFTLPRTRMAILRTSQPSKLSFISWRLAGKFCSRAAHLLTGVVASPALSLLSVSLARLPQSSVKLLELWAASWDSSQVLRPSHSSPSAPPSPILSPPWPPQEKVHMLTPPSVMSLDLTPSTCSSAWDYPGSSQSSTVVILPT